MLDLDGYEDRFGEWLDACLKNVSTMLRILRGPGTPSTPENMRMEQFLTQAESFLIQAAGKLKT